MADTGGKPGLPGGNIPKLPGSGGGGKNPLEKKELDVLDPEAKPEKQGKKGLGDIAKGIKKSIDKIKKLINFLKNIPPQVLLIIAIVVIIIFVIVGVIGFILFIPGLAINALKEFAQGAIDTVQSWFTTEADAYINEEDVVDLANYLEELEYDLVGYGFITPNPNFSQDLGIVTYTELQDQGYIYFERRGDDENARYYSQSAEEDPDGSSAFNGNYYNSLGILVDNRTGEAVDGEYVDQYGLERSTEETSNSGAGKIVGFGNDWLSGIAGWTVDTKLLRTYLLSDYKIYAIRNADGTFLNKLYSRIKKTFGGYDSAWSKGLLKFYYAVDGIADSAWSADWDSIVYGDKIKINGTTMSIRNGYFNNSTIFDIEGWADRYGMNLEFLLSLHIATMQPDLVYAMLQSFDTEVQVYLNDSGEAEVEAAYLDMLNRDVELGNEADMISFADVKATLDEQGGIDLNDWLVNDMYLTSGLSGLAISKADAQYLLDHLPLESPPNCTGAAEVDIILKSTYKDTGVFSWDDYLTLYDIDKTDMGEEAANVEISNRDVETDEGEYVDFKAKNCTYRIADRGTSYDDVIDTGYGYSDTLENIIDDDHFMFFKDIGLNLGYDLENMENDDVEHDNEDDIYCNNLFDGSVFDIDGTKTTRTWTATARDVNGNEILDSDGLTEEVEYEWVTYKFVVYTVGYDQNVLASGYTEYDQPIFTTVIVWEYITRDKTFDELVACGAIDETGASTPRSQVCSAVNHDADSSNDQTKCCKNCQKYVKKVILALAQVTDEDYASYTPYIARVLGSWFRDTYFSISEEEDAAITDYKNESNRSPSELSMIDNSWGESELVIVDEDYLAETGEYWTAYEMKQDESGNPTEEYQLYYLYPNGITSDIKMEDFLEDPYTVLEDYESGYAARYDITSGMSYRTEEEAEEAGHAFVKKAVTKTVSQLTSYQEGNNILWSAYSFNSNGAATGWLRVEYGDDNEEVNNVYDITALASDQDYYNDEGGFYYNITSTNQVTQIEDAQRSQTNPTVKWLFKYRKYYTYDGSEETAMRIAKDKEAVLNWVTNYLIGEYGVTTGPSDVAGKLGDYGRSSLRQAYDRTTITFDWNEIREQWLDWQLDMYYSGIIECPEDDYKLGDLAFIATLDEDGNTVSIRETYDLDYTPQDGEELRIGDPRDPDLIKTTNITKTSLEAFTILENTKTLASEYAYRDFKELIVELDYFDKEDLSDAIEEVFTWVLPDISPVGWPVRPWDKQDEDYGALIESKGTYDYLKDIRYGEDNETEDDDNSSNSGNTDNSDSNSNNSNNNSGISIESADQNTSEGHYSYIISAYGTEFKQFSQGGYYGGGGSGTIYPYQEGSTQIANDNSADTTLGSMGCGIYSISSLLSGYVNEEVNPLTTVEYIHENYGTSAFNSSQRSTTMDKFLNDNGVSGEWYTDDLENKINTAFNAGKPIIVYMPPQESVGPWTTSSGHFICVIGVDGSTIYTADSVDGDYSRLENTGGIEALMSCINATSGVMVWIPDNTPSGVGSSLFEGYEGGEYVSSPVTGKIIEYGTHKRENIYTGKTEDVGYVVIETIGTNYFTADNVANNSGDTEGIDNEAAANGLNLFFDEYEETCAGFTITIDGFKVDLNTTDDEGNNGTYEQNEVMALYNSAEQEEREENEQAKEDAPFFVNYGESADLGSLPEEYYCDLSDENRGYYIKEGKYLGVTYTDDESAGLTTTDTSSTDTTQEEYEGPANYIRIIVKDKEYSIIDNVEDYFNIPDPEDDSGNGDIFTGEYSEEFLYWLLVDTEGKGGGDSSLDQAITQGYSIAGDIGDGTITAAFGVTNWCNELFWNLGYQEYVNNTRGSNVGMNAGDHIPIEVCNDVAVAEIDTNVAGIQELFPGQTFTETQMAALISVYYNFGEIPDSLEQAIRSGDEGTIASTWTTLGSGQWGEYPGLRTRRESEYRMWSEGKFFHCYDSGGELVFSTETPFTDYLNGNFSVCTYN